MSVEHLELQNTNVTDEGLRYLEPLDKLESLNFAGTAISDDGLKSLARLVSVEHLELQNTNVTDEGLRMCLVNEGIETDLVRVTAAFSDDLATYAPAEDSDLYEEFLAECNDSPTPEFHNIWIEQCYAAEQIEAKHG